MTEDFGKINLHAGHSNVSGDFNVRQNARAEPPAINTLSSQVSMCLVNVLIQLGLCIEQLGCNSQLIGTASMGLE